MVRTYRSLSGLIVPLAALMLAGCATSLRNSPTPEVSTRAPPPATDAPTPELPPAAPRPAPPPREFRLSPATQSLVAQAHTLQGRGDLPGASSTLDRALRIEPSNPLLWIELGRIRLVEGDAHQAEVCGRKALALASSDQRALSGAGHLLADALRTQGRNQEASEVESRAYMH
jgi:tetratricopeptide (TPR) repeat protein